MIRQTIALLAATTMLAGCGGPGATQKVTKAGEAHSGLFGMNRTDDIKVDTAEAFKGERPVVIGNFAVAFYTHKTVAAKAGGGLMGGGFGGKSTAKSDMVGVSDATFQKITDEAYAKFVTDLKAAGYTVADRGAMVASEPFKGVTVVPSPATDSTSTLLTDGNDTKFFAPSSFKGLYAFPGIPGGGMAFGFSSPLGASALYAKDNGPRVLYVTYVVDFSNAETYGSWATSSSSVNVGQGVTVMNGASKIGIIGGESGSFSTNVGSITLGQPISSDKPFATVTDSTSDVAKGVEVATNIIGLVGGVGTNSSRHFEFKADPAKYQAAASEALKGANDSFTGKMKELK